VLKVGRTGAKLVELIFVQPYCRTVEQSGDLAFPVRARNLKQQGSA